MFGDVFQKDSVENIFNAFGVCDKIFKPMLTVNDMGISYRTINNWEANGLMLQERSSNRNWHKFSFVDFIWLNIVFELRQLGFPITKIKKLKDFLNEIIDDDCLLEVKRKEAWIFLNNSSLNRLILLLAEIMHNKNHIALLCNKNGDFYIYNEQEVKDDKFNLDISKFQFNNFVSVSLTDIIIKYLIGQKLEIIQESKILDERALELLTKLRTTHVTEVRFKINGQDELLIDAAVFDQHADFVVAIVRMILTLHYQEAFV